MMISKLIADALERTGTTVADLECELKQVKKGPALKTLSKILSDDKTREQHLLEICGPRL
tara:strand:- start:386 stop:565 length:180 start_codon:yes stop_codon:yes gene_type:complete